MAPALLQSIQVHAKESATRPNILWLVADDMCPNAACDGQPLMHTPSFDRLAREGQRFSNCYTCAPVCSPARSGLITGMYATSIDCHNHRSHRHDDFKLPAPVVPITELFRHAGYYTANVREAAPGFRATQKTDYNFPVAGVWEGTDWTQRKAGQPFFAMVAFQPPHRGPAWPQARKQPYLVDPSKIDVPPYYPDTPLVRDDLANYLDCVDLIDWQVGKVLRRLDEEGLAGNTVVMFLADHGRPMVRGKQFLYDEGTHIPLLIRWPGKLQPGIVRPQLVSNFDISASTLAAAGISIPDWMEGRDFVQAHPDGRDHTISARDRCDETIDRIRCVRTAGFKYIRNFMPERPWTQPNAYKERMYPVLKQMKQMHAEGKLTPQADAFMADHRPAEELYDLAADPHEVNNIAGLAGHRATLAQLRQTLDRWITDTKDKGAIAEDAQTIRRESAEPKKT
jgi:uncharacterized sulfatase